MRAGERGEREGPEDEFGNFDQRSAARDPPREERDPRHEPEEAAAETRNGEPCQSFEDLLGDEEPGRPPTRLLGRKDLPALGERGVQVPVRPGFVNGELEAY